MGAQPLTAIKQANFELVTKKLEKSRRNGCAICGRKNEGLVTISLQSLNSASSVKGAKTVGSKGLSMCETHASETFLHLMEQFQKYVDDNRR